MTRTRPTLVRLVPFALLVPTATSAMGVDGGAVFQILAVEELGLSPAAIGAALGLGVVSIPLQLWAARMPLAAARRNLVAFLGFAAIACWSLAALVGFVAAGEPAAVLALAVTVLAEIAVSVLFATSWQPMLTVLLATGERQVLNSRGRAGGGLVLIGVLLVFGSAATSVRVGLLAALGALLAGLAVVALRFAVPGDGHDDPPVAPASPRVAGGAVDALPTPAPGRAGLPPAVVPLLVLAGFGAASAWPLFPVYAAEVFWPEVDLGVVGAVEAVCVLGVSALWRPTDDGLLGRARIAAAVLVASAVAFVLLPAGPATGGVDVAVLVAYGSAIAARSVLLMAMLELVHRTLDATSTVRALTVLDVVASTSLQAGLFLGGLLVTASAAMTASRVDVYQSATLAVALGVAAALAWVHRRGETAATAPIG